MKKFLWLFTLSIVLASLLLAGCGKTTPTTTPTQTMTPTSTPSGPQGELVYLVSSLGNENFGLYQTTVEGAIQPPCVTNECLFRFSHVGEPVGIYPQLAEKWEESADHMTWDIYLKQGIQWQGGYGEVTAEDVKFTFDEMQNPELNANDFWFFLPPEEGGFIKSYEVVDPYHFRVQLSRNNVLFLLDITDANAVIYCKKYVEEVGWDVAELEPIGTGPWQWAETFTGDHIKFEAFDGYYGQIPDFQYLTIKAVPEQTTRLYMLQTGEADMSALPLSQYADATAAGLRVIEIPDGGSVQFRFGGQLLSTKPTYDPTVPWAYHTDEPADSEWNQRALKVRQAICLAIDYQSIIDKLTYGFAVPCPFTGITPSHDWYLKDKWIPYPYDPEQAKALLAEPGSADGFARPVEVIIPSTSRADLDIRGISEAVAANLESLGVFEVERVVMDPVTIDQMWLFDQNTAWKMLTAATLGWLPEPTWAFPYTCYSQSPNYFIGESPALDELVEQDIATSDINEREKLCQEICDWKYANYFERGLFSYPLLLAIGPKIKGLSELPTAYATMVLLNYNCLIRADNTEVPVVAP